MARKTSSEKFRQPPVSADELKLSLKYIGAKVRVEAGLVTGVDVKKTVSQWMNPERGHSFYPHNTRKSSVCRKVSVGRSNRTQILTFPPENSGSFPENLPTDYLIRILFTVQKGIIGRHGRFANVAFPLTATFLPVFNSRILFYVNSIFRLLIKLVSVSQTRSSRDYLRSFLLVQVTSPKYTFS